MIMKHVVLSLLAASAFLLSCGEATQADRPDETSVEATAATNGLPNGVYDINKVKPKISWAASKLTGDGHNGTLYIESGKFKVEDGQVKEGIVIFDMARIEVSDLTGDSKESLEGHLRSGDFFNVEEHPKAILNISGISTEDSQASLQATLTMNGEAVDYNIPVQLVEADVPGNVKGKAIGNVKGLAIQGKFDMDRTKHNIVYRSKTFDDKLDWFIKDDVSLSFSVLGIPGTK